MQRPPFSLRSAWRGCLGEGFCDANFSLAALGPQRPLALARPLSPALARRGQTNACFLVWVHRSRTTAVLVRELERSSGRRSAPYPSAASDGGQKMRRSSAKALPNSHPKGARCTTHTPSYATAYVAQYERPPIQRSWMDAHKTKAHAYPTPKARKRRGRLDDSHPAALFAFLPWYRALLIR